MSLTFELFDHEPDVRVHEAGAEIFKAGSPGDVMFAVLEGQVEIRRGGRALATMQRGEVFGEMAVIDHGPRSADAVALTKVRLAAIPPLRFMRLLQSNPFFGVQMMQNLCHKLRGDQSS